MNVVDFLTARLDEDEAQYREVIGSEENTNWALNESGDYNEAYIVEEAIFHLRDIAAKRKIIEWHRNWPVLVTEPPSQVQPWVGVGDMESTIISVSRRMAWATQAEYVRVFGTEPPTSPILVFLAMPYMEHPDHQEDWKI